MELEYLPSAHILTQGHPVIGRDPRELVHYIQVNIWYLHLNLVFLWGHGEATGPAFISCSQFKVPLPQPTNQIINQPTNQSANQPISQPTNHLRPPKGPFSRNCTIKVTCSQMDLLFLEACSCCPPILTTWWQEESRKQFYLATTVLRMAFAPCMSVGVTPPPPMFLTILTSCGSIENRNRNRH